MNGVKLLLLLGHFSSPEEMGSGDIATSSQPTVAECFILFLTVTAVVVWWCWLDYSCHNFFVSVSWYKNLYLVAAGSDLLLLLFVCDDAAAAVCFIVVVVEN